jgi:neutral ceramidase
VGELADAQDMDAECFETVVRLCYRAQLSEAEEAATQAWRFDGLTLLGLGHEVLSGYVEALQDEASQPLWVSAYVNEVAIYIPTDEAAPPTPSPMYWYSVGWDAGSPLVAGKESNLVAYGWPKPLRTAVHGAAANDQPSAERLLLAACRRALR